MSFVLQRETPGPRGLREEASACATSDSNASSRRGLEPTTTALARFGPLVAIALYVALAMTTLALPPLGRDSWRESDVLSVGRNYCVEDAPFFTPRVDARRDTNGVTGMEFPILNYLAGRAACAGLDQVRFARSVTLAFTLIGALSLFGLAVTVFGRSSAALLTLTAFLFSPLLVYYGRGVQSDVPALASALLGLDCLRRYRRRGSAHAAVAWLAASAVAMALGILVKLPVIVLGLPALLLLSEGRSWRQLVRARYVVYLVVTLAPAITWYRWAHILQDVSGLHYIYLGKTAAEILSDLSGLAFYEGVLSKLLDAYIFPPCAIAAAALFVLGWRRLPAWVSGFAVASIVYALLSGGAIAHHTYYGILVVPALALGASAGWWLLEPRLTPRRAAIVLVLLLTSVVAHGLYRARGWFPRDEAVVAEVVAAGVAVASKTTAADRAVYFSGMDPTLLWFIDRKGWLEDVADCGGPLPLHGARVAVVDLARFPADCAEAMANTLATEGWQSVAAGTRLRVWVR